jgi:hypothetical protein
MTTRGVNFHLPSGGQFSAAVDRSPLRCRLGHHVPFGGGIAAARRNSRAADSAAASRGFHAAAQR